MSAQHVLFAAVLVCAGYLCLVYVSYLVLIVVGLVESLVRRSEARTHDYELLAESRFTIPVSVILAAYNEEPAVSTAVRSLLAQEYVELEVIVVNDGSTDGTLERLVKDFALEPVELFPRRIIEAAEVRAYYRSADVPHLLVIDKENGGKADALNAGINLARYRYVCGVDADTIFSPDALLRGMRLVMSDPAGIVGVTAHVAIARDPSGAMTAPHGRRPVDLSPLLAYQHLDYLRAFFNNRVAWTRLNFMLCAIGAFQIWRRDLLEELGGFAQGFTCEDIELTFRVHETMRREGRPYRVLCLPDSVGITEGPDTVRKLVAQRERWQRVIVETVWAYRRMAFRPRYGSVGIVGVPYYVLSEVLAPVFEVFTLVTLAAASVLGLFDWQVFLLVTGVITFVNAAMTAAAVLSEDLHSRAYGVRWLVWLLVLAPLDLVLYRPVMFWARAKGTWRFLRRDQGWHKFERNQRAESAA
ncbi:MAG: glycosyltransferase family 2 protein [Thermoleophilia bacterium]|nr:glycosyltransferase family 2 protein [Thermoleophilia bacterium]MDH5332870.1 glycosyltransferase family 2 protein [Thermoleophilia bacterium]